MNALALGLLLLYFALTLALPVAVRWRRSRSTGLRVARKRAGALERTAGALELLALGCGIAAAIAADDLTPLASLDVGAADVAGAIVFLGAVALIMLSQATMGESWRIGVDPDERTALVTSGVFRLVRHPIYTGLVILLIGLGLVVPNVLAAVALVSMILWVELQARAIEEPYLLATHGAEYARYAAGVGRFIPGIGRIREPERTGAEVSENAASRR
jgi:protein-S-isoprenylcysteine O-methyltransferase Ste14